MSRPFRKIFPLQTAESEAVNEPGPCILTTGFLEPLSDYGPWEVLDLQQVGLILTIYGFGAVAEPPAAPVIAWLEVNGIGVVQFEPVQVAGPGNLSAGAAGLGGFPVTGWSEWYGVTDLSSPIRMIASDSIQIRITATIPESSGNVLFSVVSPADAAVANVGNAYRGSSVALSGVASPDE